MLDLIRSTGRRCDGLSRRSFLQVGSVGLAGLTLADALRAKARAEGNTSRSLAERSVILIWLDGGPPQHETYDPKPDAPDQFRGPLKAISTRLPGVQVSELLPNHARLMDRMSVIRSLHHDNGDHFAAAHWMLTGYLGSNAINMAPQYPSAGSIVATAQGGEAARDAGVCRTSAYPFCRVGTGLPWRSLSGSGLQPLQCRRRSQFGEIPRAQPGITARRGCAAIVGPTWFALGFRRSADGPRIRPARWRASINSNRKRSRWSWATELDALLICGRKIRACAIDTRAISGDKARSWPAGWWRLACGS